MNSDVLDRTKLPWKVLGEELVVYRGQSGKAEKKSSIAGAEARRGWDKILSVFRDKPSQISTSKRLNTNILKFADGYNETPPQGRLFQIDVKPGVRYVDINAEADAILKAIDESQNHKFEFIITESRPHWVRESANLIAAKLEKIKATKAHGKKAPEEQLRIATEQAKTQHYSSKTPTYIRDMFAINSSREREVLLDLAGTEFVLPDGAPETWVGDTTQVRYVVEEEKQADGSRKEILSTGTVPVYPTILRPKASAGGRRGRTFRRKPKRRDKNGGRPTRKSKPRRHK